jgi:hypothetical protein
MKKIVVSLVIISLLCLGISTPAFSMTLTNKNNEAPKEFDEIKPISKHQNYYTTKTIDTTLNDNFGIWIHTKYNGLDDSKNLGISLQEFKLMLDGAGWRYYDLEMNNNGITTVGLQFSRTKIYVDEEQEYVNVFQTKFNFETTGDTTEDYEASIEVRFPFQVFESSRQKTILFSKFLDLFSKFKLIKPFIEEFSNKWSLDESPDLFTADKEEYFCVRLGFASPQGEEGPKRVETRFFSGRNSIWEPKVYRMQITPYDLGREYSLSYFNSYQTVTESGSEATYRLFSIDFEPASELQITSIPGKAKIAYNFGSSSGAATKISLIAEGGSLSGITQSFLIDPLPSNMAFDLTILGERSFKYESPSTYSVTYSVDSEQDGNYVKLELEDIPKTITAEWGLSIGLLAKSVSGLIDLDMSSDLGRAAVSLYGSETPFMEIQNFPQKLEISGHIDIDSLSGYITADKYSGSTTIINVPISYDIYEITGRVELNNGYGHASFNLPDGASDYVSVGLDTNDNGLFGIGLQVYDTEQEKEILDVSVAAIATENLYISFNYVEGGIQDLSWNGKITQLVDLYVSIDFSGFVFDISGDWNVGDAGSFEVTLNQPVEVQFVDIESENFKMNGYISLNEDSYVKIEWEWGPTGYFMVFTREPIGNELYFEVGYGPIQNDNYQWGLRVEADGFLDIKRTVMWDTNPTIPRIWILGDEPFPGDWDVWVLLNWEWYEVK